MQCGEHIPQYVFLVINTTDLPYMESQGALQTQDRRTQAAQG